MRTVIPSILIQSGSLVAIDWMVIATYFALRAGVATWVVRRSRTTATDGG